MGIYTFLVDVAFPPRPSELVVRSISTHSFISAINPEQASDTIIPCTFLYRYSHPWVEATVIEAKFHANKAALSLLSAAFKEYIFQILAEDTHYSRIVIVPVPLSRKRLKERGYNQVERCIREALRSGNLSTCLNSTLLTRTRNTLPQTTLSGSARRKNLVGAFMATEPCNPSYTYIVVDDVTTTGATLSAAVEALKAAGATHIRALSLAH